MKTKLLGLIACMALLGVSQAKATTYSVINATSVTGTITTDGTIGLLDKANITDWSLTLFGTDVLNPSDSFLGFSLTSGLSATSTQLLFNYSGSSLEFAIVDNPPGNDAVQWFEGGVSAIIPPVLGSREFYEGTQPIGQVSAAPLPAALPLFAAGLGAMGLLGWRRKRKYTAGIAA
jgi:hypothetical protein